MFCDNLDWLVSKLDRLEASSGEKNLPTFLMIQYEPALMAHSNHIPSAAGILEVLYCVLIESPEVLNIIQENHIKSIISLLDKHGRNHKVGSKKHQNNCTPGF